MHRYASGGDDFKSAVAQRDQYSQQKYGGGGRGGGGGGVGRGHGRDHAEERRQQKAEETKSKLSSYNDKVKGQMAALVELAKATRSENSLWKPSTE